MEKKLSFFGRMKAKRRERLNARLAASYKRGYEYGAGRLLSEGMDAEHELCAQAEGSRTFGEYEFPDAKQFDLGVLAAVRDFTILLRKPEAFADSKNLDVTRTQKPTGV